MNFERLQLGLGKMKNSTEYIVHTPLPAVASTTVITLSQVWQLELQLEIQEKASQPQKSAYDED